MSTDLRATLTYITALGIVGAALLILTTGEPPVLPPDELTATTQVANVVSAEELVLPVHPLAAEPEPVSVVETQTLQAEQGTPSPPASAENTASVVRIQNPYPTPSLSFLVVNDLTRAALVNILCSTQDATLQSSSGSGVIIDPRGIILTNAHVAQYVLLSQSGRTNLSCVTRSGAPAQTRWGVEVLYIPPVWVRENAKDITVDSPRGTGERDYALLRIIELPEDGLPLPASFPFLPVDSREGIGFPTDPVVAASYPSEFVGARATQFNLHPASSITSVKTLLTFESDTIDLISVGGVPEAQSGSSGGAVVNLWGYLIGIITTTSEGLTTADRELRALTLSYVNRDLLEQSGSDLREFLSGDPAAHAAEFKTMQAPSLTQLLLDEIAKRRAQ